MLGNLYKQFPGITASKNNHLPNSLFFFFFFLSLLNLLKEKKNVSCHKETGKSWLDFPMAENGYKVLTPKSTSIKTKVSTYRKHVLYLS